MTLSSSAPATLTEARRLSEVRRLRLTWSDGHTADFDYDYLRGYCPCAMCQGHSGIKVVFHRPRKPVTMDTLQPVGNYALSMIWSDGHATGIYRFDFLRQLCPCPDHANYTWGAPGAGDPQDVVL